MTLISLRLHGMIECALLRLSNWAIVGEHIPNRERGSLGHILDELTRLFWAFTSLQKILNRLRENEEAATLTVRIWIFIKPYFEVIAGLWVLSIVGSWCNFLTLFYIGFVLLHTVPVLYEKYEHQVDSFAEVAMAEIKKHYAVFDAKVLSKIPRGPLGDKKRA